jgi:hypothetical protein
MEDIFRVRPVKNNQLVIRLRWIPNQSLILVPSEQKWNIISATVNVKTAKYGGAVFRTIIGID